ncbi:hypothetical protein LJC16_03860 [Bacteroidales bacterium OttesenSCG-928-C19]|nr:hypothetical protein [Bacteroidales bacterium OttesenSCG-928-C19]
MYKSYFKKLSIFSAVIFVLTILWGFISPNSYLQIFPVVVIYFFGITAVEHFLFVRKSTKGDSKDFIKTNMMTSFGKFFIHLCVITIYAFSFKENAKKFLIFFAVMYIVYLMYDTYMKMRLAKK